jgi:hypothetical protein
MLTLRHHMSAPSPLSVTEHDFPANGSPRQKLDFALKFASLAPTESGWQPWYFRVEDSHLELMAKNNPVRETADPDRRGFMIGCGTALLYLKLALKHFSCLGQVVLFPDLGQPLLVAKIHFGCCCARDAREKLLFRAMAGSPTNHSPLGETSVSETMLSALSHAAAGERGWLDFVQSETSRQHVLKVTLSGEERGNGVGRPLYPVVGRGEDSWRMAVEAVHESSVAAATLAVVKTKTDDKHGWLEAGQTMARTVLQAQALGLSWAFFNPVRRREAREALRVGIGHKGFAQVILRFGPLVPDEMVQLSDSRAGAAIFR